MTTQEKGALCAESVASSDPAPGSDGQSGAGRSGPSSEVAPSQHLLEAQQPGINASLGSTQRDSGFPLIVHCHLRWDFVWQRPQQIFSRIARSRPVLFIEDPQKVDGPPRLDITEPVPNVVRLVPLLQPSDDDVDTQCRVLLPLIDRALSEHPLLAGRFEQPIQWFYSPMTAPVLLGRFGARGVVYDCMDELANFRFAPGDLGAREQLLLSRANVVFTGGYQLFESKSRLHANVHFHGCGVDVAHFSRARLAETRVPASVALLPPPILGYFGVIDERLDYVLISALADAFPDASVVMVGPLAKVEQHELPHRMNLHWLGQQAYEDLPALVKGFDVCLMPFAMNEATAFINPTKTLEYMASGKPIVSTAVPDVVRNFSPIVDVARSHIEFLSAVGRAIREPDAAVIARGIKRAQNASWDATVDSMLREIQQALAASTVAGATQH